MKFPNLILSLTLFASSLVQAQGLVKFEQVPLSPLGADLGLIFIGGFMDELTGIMHNVYEHCPRMKEPLQEQRAYYHWHGDALDQDWPHMQDCLRDVGAFQTRNPTAPLILIGHSMGAVAAFELANRIQMGDNPIYLLTLDPVDRQSARVRGGQIDWWGHAYVTQSPSSRDVIYEAAGRWGSQPAADVNLNCGGGHFIHDWASALLLKPGGNDRSLFQYLQSVL